MPSKECGTRSGAAKVKTKQGSNDKKDLNKTGVQQRHYLYPKPTLPEDLTGATFSGLRPATFKKTIMRLSGYATHKYRHYMVQDVQTRQPNIFSHPPKPSDKDISEDSYGAKYWWQAECTNMMAGKKAYTSNLRKMSPTVLGCCDEDLRGKVQNWDEFDSIESSSDTLDLLNAIEQGGTDYRPPSIPLPPIIKRRSSPDVSSRIKTVAATPCTTT